MSQSQGRMTTRNLAIIAVTAAMYVALTFVAPAYGMFQFRLSETLNLLGFINPIFAPGVILGCFISNLFSPNGALLDCIVGTAHTAIAMLFIVRFSKNIYIASIWPTLFSPIIGAMIFYVDEGKTLQQFLIITGTVMVTEFVVVSILGVLLFSVMLANKPFKTFMKSI